jgi:hypothetical protein
MARAKKPPAQEKPQLAIHSVALTAEEVDALRRLSREASDFLGWSISNSAIVRALLRQIVKQGPAEADALFVEIERELKAGVRWGKQR